MPPRQYLFEAAILFLVWLTLFAFGVTALALTEREPVAYKVPEGITCAMKPPLRASPVS